MQKFGEISNNSIRIKIETPDCQPEDLENVFQSPDNIEVSGEFKTEPSVGGRISDKNSNLFCLENLIFYCNQCNKTLKLSEKKAKKCDTCKSSGKFKCGKCMKIYSFGHLNRHLKIHSNQEPKIYCCDHCKYKTGNKWRLSEHIQARHLPLDPNLYKCSKCEKSFSTKVGLNHHSKICGQTNDFKRSLVHFSCSHCDYKTLYKSNLNRHISDKHLHRDSHLKCKKCAKVYLNPASFKIHLKMCGQTVDVKRSFRPYSCEHCEHKATSKGRLLDHIQAKHLPREPGSNKCEKCGKSYSCRQSLQVHLRKWCIAVSVKPSTMQQYFCDHCSYNTHRKDYLANHMQAKHLPRDPNLNKCSRCQMSFLQRQTLKKHSKICGRTKDFKDLMKRFTCDHCNHKSANKSTLFAHIQSKHLSITFKCTGCKKVYNSQKSIRRHAKYACKVLPSTKKFCCDHCGYKSNRKLLLKNHIQMKHLNEVFECSACGKSFRSQHNLYQHSKIRCKNIKSIDCAVGGKSHRGVSDMLAKL